MDAFSNKISFDVIIPTYNRAVLIERAVLSVLNQSYPYFNLYIVDDGSTDETRDVLEKFLIDERVHYLFQKNSGVSAARNLGIKSSKASWVTFLDSDDEWLTHKLEKQKQSIENNLDCGFFHSEEIWIREGVRVNPPAKFSKKSAGLIERSLETCIISPSTVAIKRDLLLQFQGFDEAFQICEDYDLWLKILLRQPVGFIEEALIKKFHGHEGQLSTMDPLMEYYRVWALFNQMGSADLSFETKMQIKAVLERKIPSIIKGLRKFEQQEKLSFVEERARFFAILN